MSFRTDLNPRLTRRVCAAVLVMAAIYFASSLGLILIALFNLDSPDRAAFLDLARESIGYWSSFCVLALVLAVFVFRFNSHSTPTKRAVVVVCAISGVAAGMVAEWWTCLFFVLPAVFLALSDR
jgi:hypothetical protein